MDILKRRSFYTLVASGLLLVYCSKTQTKPQVCQISSPTGNISISFFITDKGQPAFVTNFNGKPILDTSTLGYIFKEVPDFGKSFKIINTDSSYFLERWKPVTGAFASVKNEYNQLRILLEDASANQIQIYLRLFDEGIALRYEVLKLGTFDTVNVLAEKTAFGLTGNHKAWWNEAHYDSYEIMFNTTDIRTAKQAIASKMTKSEMASELYMKNFGGTIAFNTPLTMVTADSVYLCFHEADLTNYAEMTLAIVDSTSLQLQSELVPWPDGIKVKTKVPFISPWRTVHITSNPANLMVTQMEENLNPPSKITDPSFITPYKYMGVWWGYHIGKYTWDPRGRRGAADSKDPSLAKKPHGASTENCKSHIDFLAANGIPFLLIEGWNPTNYAIDSVDNFLRSHPDFDLAQVVAYGRNKGVEIMIHNESMGQARNLERQADAAFANYEKLGIRAMKIGWAWHMEATQFNRAWGTDSASLASYTGGKYYQHSQWSVQHYRRILEIAAQHRQMVTLHEYVKETGIRRTYPNLMALEGLRGNEYNAWDRGQGNPPEHVTIVPFTRQVAGPIDYTPGIFDVLFDAYKGPQRVNATLANQLALYVVFYSPVQMAADLPENYKGHPAFQFIKDVPTNWDTTVVLKAAIGDVVAVARSNADNWYVGAVTDENKRSVSISLGFLTKGVKYKLTQYADAPDADWKLKPTAYQIRSFIVQSTDTLNMQLAAGGGQALSIVKVSE